MTTIGKGKIALAIASGRRIRNVVEARVVGCEQMSAQFSGMDLRPSRFDPSVQRWLELQDSFARWGKGLSVERLQQLGESVRADQ